MATPNGYFDETTNYKGGFDETSQPAGWFDADLLGSDIPTPLAGKLSKIEILKGSVLTFAGILLEISGYLRSFQRTTQATLASTTVINSSKTNVISRLKPSLSTFTVSLNGLSKLSIKIIAGLFTSTLQIIKKGQSIDDIDAKTLRYSKFGRPFVNLDLSNDKHKSRHGQPFYPIKKRNSSKISNSYRLKPITATLSIALSAKIRQLTQLIGNITAEITNVIVNLSGEIRQITRTISESSASYITSITGFIRSNQTITSALFSSLISFSGKIREQLNTKSIINLPTVIQGLVRQLSNSHQRGTFSNRIAVKAKQVRLASRHLSARVTSLFSIVGRVRNNARIYGSVLLSTALKGKVRNSGKLSQALATIRIFINGKSIQLILLKAGLVASIVHLSKGHANELTRQLGGTLSSIKALIGKINNIPVRLKGIINHLTSLSGVSKELYRIKQSTLSSIQSVNGLIRGYVNDKAALLIQQVMLSEKLRVIENLKPSVLSSIKSLSGSLINQEQRLKGLLIYLTTLQGTIKIIASSGVASLLQLDVTHLIGKIISHSQNSVSQLSGFVSLKAKQSRLIEKLKGRFSSAIPLSGFIAQGVKVSNGGIRWFMSLSAGIIRQSNELGASQLRWVTQLYGKIRGELKLSKATVTSNTAISGFVKSYQETKNHILHSTNVLFGRIRSLTREVGSLTLVTPLNVLSGKLSDIARLLPGELTHALSMQSGAVRSLAQTYKNVKNKLTEFVEWLIVERSSNTIITEKEKTEITLEKSIECVIIESSETDIVTEDNESFVSVESSSEKVTIE